MTTSIGSSVSRKDGVLKITGQARYAADHPIGNVTQAVALMSTIARGRITGIDSAAAEKAPGFLAVIHHGNAPKLYQSTNDFMSATKPGETRIVFEDDRVYYAGQYVALVVAETLQQAQFAASLVKIIYEAQEPAVEISKAGNTLYDPADFFGDKLAYLRGNPESAFQSAAVKHEATYTTPSEHHNPMEPSASIAEWSGDELTLYETTQWVVGARNTVAEILGMPQEKIHIISPFIGGGFGCKGFIWPHSILSAIAAKKVGRPVKLNLTRKQMFSAVGHRSETIQKISLGCGADGRLNALLHDTTVYTSIFDEFVEACGATIKQMYSCPNVRIAHHAARLNIGTPTPMRAPGENPGMYAFESALDELAYKLKMDPVQLRVINHADKNEFTNQPFSSKYLKECYQVAGDKFGWAKRNPEPRSMRDGKLLIGMGMATATYPGMRSPGAAKVRILQDGSATVASATQDMGGGTYTTMAQVVADVTGIPIENIRSDLGDSHMPPAPVSGGSMTTASVLPAVKAAAQEALKKLIQAAIADEKSPLHGRKEEDVMAANGRLFVKGSSAESGVPFSSVLQARNLAAIEGESTLTPGEERTKYAFQSFGAQFVEVKVDPEIAKITVSRVCSAFDVGRIINAKTARSQAYSGIIMGLGMALMEHTVYDQRDGSIVNSNLADYAVPVNADIHSIDVSFIDKPDPYIDNLGIGARGVGEITVTGVAAALANAVYHATGKRIRDLPITPEKLL
jgi:xanthine dehydrogenase YagR molybdenum-binding subunit